MPTNTWELDREIEIAFDVMNLPPRDADVTNTCPAVKNAGWRCANCCWKSRICCCWTSRRTTWMPSRCNWLERTSAELSRNGRRGDSRPVFSGQRCRMDSGTGSGRRISVRRKLLVLAGAETTAAGKRRKTVRRPAENSGTRAGVDSNGTPGPAGQEQGPDQRLRTIGGGSSSRHEDELEIQIPARQAAGRFGFRSQGSDQGLRRQAC